MILVNKGFLNSFRDAEIIPAIKSRSIVKAFSRASWECGELSYLVKVCLHEAICS